MNNAARRITAVLTHALPYLTVLLSACAPELPLPPINSEQEAKITGLVEEVSRTELNAVLSDLDGIRHYLIDEEDEGDPMTVYEERIIARFESWGYTTERQAVTVPEPESTTTMNNIIVEKRGTDPSLAPVLYTGHWDSVSQGPGINDNATACAAVMEAARILAPEACRRSILFILYALEEEGLIGSYHFAENHSDEIHGVINFDMIGYTAEGQDVLPLTDTLLGFPETGDFIAVFASHFSWKWAVNYVWAIETFVPDLPYYMAILDNNLANDPLLWDVMRSDHTPLWERGVPGVFLTDTAELREGHPYHTENDTIERLDFDFFTKNVQAGLAALCIEAELTGGND